MKSMYDYLDSEGNDSEDEKKAKKLYKEYAVKFVHLLKDYGFKQVSTKKDSIYRSVTFMDRYDNSIVLYAVDQDYFAFCYDTKNMLSIYPHIFYNSIKTRKKYLDFTDIFNFVKKAYPENLKALEDYLKKIKKIS